MIYSPIFYSFCHTEQFPEPEPAVAPSGPRGRCASQLQAVQAVSSSWIVNFVKQLNAMDGDSVVRSSYPSCIFFSRKNFVTQLSQLSHRAASCRLRISTFIRYNQKRLNMVKSCTTISCCSRISVYIRCN
jgi:hypothetical protein